MTPKADDKPSRGGTRRIALDDTPGRSKESGYVRNRRADLAGFVEHCRRDVEVLGAAHPGSAEGFRRRLR